MTDSADDEIVGASPHVRFSSGFGRELLHFPLSQRVCLAASAEAWVLSACSGFRTTGEHINFLAQKFPEIHDEQVFREIIARFRSVDGIIPLGRLLEAARTKHPSVSPGKIEWLAIPTRGRVGQLSRAIQSYASNCREFGRRIKYIVASDEDDGSRDAFEKVSEEFGLVGSHAGPAEKASFVGSLCQGGDIPREIVQFALFGDSTVAGLITTGANRNALLLQTIGSRILSVDDDTVCRPTIAFGGEYQRGDVRFGCGDDPTDILCFENEQDAINHLRPIPLDPIAEHEALLSRSIGAAVIEGPITDGGLIVEGSCSHAIESILLGVGSIRVTYNGVGGDCGLNSNLEIVAHPRQSTRNRLMLSSSVYRRMLASRSIVRQVPSTTVFHEGGPRMGMFMGLDNCDILPPFLPAFRGQDRLFSLVLNKCATDAFFGYLPFTMDHMPEGLRTYRGGQDGEVRVSDVFGALIGSWPKPVGLTSTRDNLVSLGRYLIVIAKQPTAAFTNQIRTMLAARAAFIGMQCETLISKFGQEHPRYWADDLRNRAEAAVSAAITVGLQVSDLPVQDPTSSLQIWVEQFGTLLVWWPAIMDKARTLKMQEVEIGRKIGRS